ncbi:ABC transporter ATP-binding protein [Methanocalculus sp. MC3]
MTLKRPFDRIETIDIHGVRKRFGETVAVDGISLDIRGGELLILIGGSGSGKTTTLRMINRLIDPDEGTIAINGIDTQTIDGIVLRKNIGYVIQQIGLFPHMTIRENIGLLPTIEGWSREEIDSRVAELLILVHLPPDQFMDRYPKELSGGQQQRVGLARALVMNPPLLLMDEPFGALDPLLRRQLQDEFIGIKEDIGKTIVFVTHDINEAFRLGDRIAIMHEGQIVQLGTPRDLILNPADKMVSDLVGSDRLFGHIASLTVSDMMVPASPIISGEMEVQSAIGVIVQSGSKIAVVRDRASSFSVAQLSTLLQMRDEVKTVLEATDPPFFLSMDASLLSALEEMKAASVSLGLVMKDGEPAGLLLPDDLISRLV